MKLSLIIATYNASGCLKSCLDSIVPQILLRKREKLKWHFQDEIMAEMKIGGVSFSMAAIREAYRIRKFRFENIKARLREWITGQTNEFPPEF